MLDGYKQIHFIGIGGYGMSALAGSLLQLGYRITGSDIKDSRIISRLRSRGAVVSIGHREENLGSPDLVVYSTAVPKDNPELKAAFEQGITVWHRSALLAEMLNNSYGIAVAGAHGKTTTTALTALLLTDAGKDPTAIIGGEIKAFDGNSRVGSGKFLVAEADESDTSFLRYHPSMAVVTNVEADHLEHYDGDFNKLIDTYQDFLQNVKPQGVAVINKDDHHLSVIRHQLSCRISTYGIVREADYRAVNLQRQGLGYRFTLLEKEKDIGDFTLRIPGLFNVYNALAALAAALPLGVSPQQAALTLKKFSGVKRRFEILAEAEGITVVDDYAHHPTEIRSTLKAARDSGYRVVAVFQPHRFTRTQFLFRQFADAFSDASLLILGSIYTAGETTIPGVNSQALAEEIRLHTDTPVELVDTADDMAAKALELARPGDVLLFMGAGDVTGAAATAAEKLLARAANAR